MVERPTKSLNRLWPILIGSALLLFSVDGWAQALPLVTATQKAGTTVYSVPVQTLLALTALSFLPAALVLMTSFTRILIVFSLLRQALGLQSVPPNIVLIGLSLFLDRKSTRLNSSHIPLSRMPSSA